MNDDIIDINGVKYQKITPEKKKVERWKPTFAEYYYSTMSVVYQWKNDSIDNMLYSLGLIFKTKQERDNYIARQQAIVRVNDRIDELNNGWEPDWSDEFEKLYIHSYNGSCRLYSTCAYFCTQVRTVASVEVGEKIISEMEEDLKLIFKY